MIVFRLDANPTIGSGHAIRCVAVATELVKLGEETMFVVSDESSAKFLQSFGVVTRTVEGDPMSLTSRDGEALAIICEEVAASSVLVDTYAATDDFLFALFNTLPGGIQTVHIDDCYTFSEGRLLFPKDRGFDLVINYGFAYTISDYRPALERGARVLAGPMYAPIRPGFNGTFEVNDRISRVMVTTGSTNPKRSLERMVRGVRDSGLDCRIVVVVGRQSLFDKSCLDGCDNEVLYDVTDMADLMRSSDIVVSAAGTTLYELASVCVPTIALPIVDNQLPNAEGFKRLALGPSSITTCWEPQDVSLALRDISRRQIREKMSKVMNELRIGNGAALIAAAL